MNNEILGIHHITALASDPQQNLDFYVGLLGLRCVKRTVNFDAPDVYHFYYGDELGRPGTILTFFPFPHAERGKKGTGQATAVAFSIPQRSLEYWVDRLAARAVHFDGPFLRFNEEYIVFDDPDGMQIELVTQSSLDDHAGWRNGPVPVEHALRGFHGATLSQVDHKQTGLMLTGAMGFRFSMSEGNRYRFVVGAGFSVANVDILDTPEGASGRMSAGCVHHIAWRTANKQEQEIWREKIAGLGYSVTPIVDRQYFTSIYYHEPGGVLFEIATDPPGFTVDESPEELGTSLKLPPWLEPRRERLEELLPPVTVPNGVLANLR